MRRADHGSVATKRLKLRRPDRCSWCAAELPAGAVAQWDSSTRAVTCVVCAELTAAAAAPDLAADAELARGVAGASIGREHTRRRTKREQRVREAHPHIGGILLALSTPPQHEEAFRIGEQGEIAVAASLEKAVARVGGVVLHNRRMPGGRGDIDHIAIVPSGVYVIDAKAVKGKIEIRHRWFKPPLLFIAGRDRTKYLGGLDRQTLAVRDAVEASGLPPVPLRGALCFTDADPPFLRTVEVRGHLLLYRKALTKRLTAPGPRDSTDTHQLAAAISSLLPPA